MNTDLLDKTVHIAAAYLGHNSSEPVQIPDLLNTIHGALHKLSTDGVAPMRPEPSVPIDKSVTPEAVHCLDCSFAGKMLKRHIASAHNLTSEGYRARWGLPESYSLTAPNYAKRRSKIAKQTGLGKHAKR